MKFARSFQTLILLPSIAAMLISPAWAASQLVFDHSTFDFGKVTQGKKVDHVFVFRNRGDAPVTIQRVGSSCGCTVATLSSRVINPGKAGEIKATFDSSDFSGPVSKEVLVYTADPQKPTHTLFMKGVVIEEIVMTPGQLNLGEVKAGTAKEGLITMENRGAGTLRIKGVRSANPQIKATCDKQSLRPGEKATIRVSLTPRGNARFINGYITISTDSRIKPEKEVAVFSSVKK